MYLIDSNIWLELLLRQKRAEEVRRFLQKVDADELALTEFTLYSIGIITTRLRKDDVFETFLSDVLGGTGIKRISLNLSDLKQMPSSMRKYGLDFDDAYQYVASKRYNLILVSFDSDFDNTDLKKRTPGDIMADEAGFN